MGPESNTILERGMSGKDWPVSTICKYAVFIWFGASLFSQSVYMGFNGRPYDANLLLESIGPFAWIIITIELVVWTIVAIFLGGKIVNRVKINPSDMQVSESV